MAHDCAKHLLPAFGFRWCYAELKAKAMNGERSRLSHEELEFVGATDHWHDTSGGWHQPYDTYELDSVLSAEDTALLQALMNAGSADRVEFMG